MINKVKQIKKNVHRSIIALMAMILIVGNFDLTTIRAANPRVTTGDIIRYSYNVTDSEGHGTFGQESYYIYVDGEIAFCVEPGQLVDVNANYSASKYSSAQRTTIENIAYVGWELSNKTDEDYIATQYMIWEALGATLNSTSYSGYSAKKRQIQNKIDLLFNTNPSFTGDTINLKVGESVTLTDANGVFNNYSLSSKSTGITISKSRNKLTITANANAPENATISYQLVKEECVGTTMLYSAVGSQDCITAKKSDPKGILIHLNVEKYGSLKITKQDEDGTYVPDTSFKVSANADMSDPIGTYTTGSDGTVTINDLTPDTYYVQETAVPDHLVLDPAVHSVTVQANQTATFTARNNWKKGRVLIRKTDQDSGKQVAGAVYAIYDADDDQEVARLTTLADGYATSDYLRFGSYYVKEVIAPDGYILNDTKYPVTITENEQKIEVSGVDERVRGSIRIEKVDNMTGDIAQGDATLVGAKYGLYAREAILDPADQAVIYEKDARIAELTIDEERQAAIDDLYLGKYYIKEITPSEGYTLDETEYDVTLAYQGQTTATVTIDQTVKEQVITGRFQITKFITDGEQSEIVKPEQGAEFTVVLQKYVDQYGSVSEAIKHRDEFADREWDILTTDKNGIAVSKDLAYGVYVVEQTKGTIDTDNVPNFTFTVDTANQEMKYYHINNKPLKAYVQIVKKDAESGKTVALSGTSFKIKDAKGNFVSQKLGLITIDTFITNADGIVMTPLKLDAGDYTLVEVTAPNGYLINKDEIPFTITTDNTEVDQDGDAIIVVECENQVVKGRIRIEKRGEVLTGFENGQFVYEERSLAGMRAEVVAAGDILDPSNDGTVIYPAGTLVDTVTTDENGEALSKELSLGTYEIREVRAPDGYVLSDEVKTVELTYEDQETAVVYSEVQTITNERQKVKVTATKQDADTQEYLAGAEISLYANRKVYNYDGEVILQSNDRIATAVTNADGEAVFDIDLPLDLTPEHAADPLTDEDFSIAYEDGIRYEGDLNALWYVQETKAPVGYTSGVTVRYLFDTTYTDQDQPVQEFTFAFQNEKSKIEITKTDITGEKELPGAHLQVLDANGQVVDEWVSGEGAHRIEGLSVGETYQLKETIAPDGYAVTDTITFTVQDTSEIQQVVMKDELTHIQVLKVDEEGDPFAGNELAIVDANGNIIEQWTSTEEAHDIYGLIGGATYTLKEIAPVNGYRTADPIEFTVPTTNEEKFVVTMQNEKVLTDIQVLKVDSVTNQVIRSKDFAFTLYSDAECMEEIETVHANTTDGTATFEDLPYGVYYVKETAAPDGYLLSDEVIKVELNDQTEGIGEIYSFVYFNQPVPSTQTSATNDTGWFIMCIVGSGLVVLSLTLRRKAKNK